MGKRTTLLATVALPLVSLVLEPVHAASVRPVLSLDAPAHVMTVQAQGELSEEELLKRRKQQREERRKQRDAGEAEQQKPREERRKQREAGEGQQQNDRQKAREERRQKQQEAEQGQQQNDRQKAREERRQKQQEAEQGQQQNDRQKAREERRQKQQEAEKQQQRQEDRQKARDDKRQKEREAAEKEQQQQQPRTKERARDEQRGTSRESRQEQERLDNLRQAEKEMQLKKERVAAERKKRLEAEKKEREAAEKGKRAENRRKRDAERERIARDPGKTTDTIELPYERGTAVLDSDKDSDNRRGVSREETRRKRAEERAKVRVRVPQSDADAQIDRDGKRRKPVRYESVERERGQRRDRRPEYESRDGWRVERRVDNRQVINIDNRIIVRSDDGRRLSRRATETYYEELPRGRVREVIVRPNGDRVVTIRDRFGEVIQRSRIDRSGREYVMFYAPEIDRDSRPTFVDPGLRLPPMRLSVPLEDYIIDTSSEAPRDYRVFLDKPPVEEVERVYTLDEVKYSARIRDKVRRIDLDTITFATGSADISESQAATLGKVADAINEILDKDPGETFLIEGHTDAVGSEESNLVLSDERAESVADILTDVYDIPPENLATQGYGERFLKIATDGAEQLNRRVTIRRVTPLVKPVAMAE